MLFFNKKRKQNQTDYSHIRIYYDVEDVLEKVIIFLKAYHADVPDEWYFFDARAYNGQVEFKIDVGCWYDSLLYANPDIKNYMFSKFSFDEQKNTFIYAIIDGEADTASLVGMLHQIVNKYKSIHPDVQFEQTVIGEMARFMP